MQVSRLGNPLFNEVIVPLGKKDRWNGSNPVGDWAHAANVEHPELAKLLPVLYPGVFPNLAGLSAARADLVAILLTGLPSGIVPGFQNYTGKTLADMLRRCRKIPGAGGTRRNPLRNVSAYAVGRQPCSLKNRKAIWSCQQHRARPMCTHGLNRETVHDS